MPGRVAGPAPQPLAGHRWNSAQLSGPPGTPPHAALASLAGNGDRLVLSYAPLAQDQTLLLDIFARTHSAPEAVRLTQIEHVEASSLYIYRASPAPVPVPAGVPQALSEPAASVDAAYAAH